MRSTREKLASSTRAAHLCSALALVGGSNLADVSVAQLERWGSVANFGRSLSRSAQLGFVGPRIADVCALCRRMSRLWSGHLCSQVWPQAERPQAEVCVQIDRHLLIAWLNSGANFDGFVRGLSVRALSRHQLHGLWVRRGQSSRCRTGQEPCCCWFRSGSRWTYWFLLRLSSLMRWAQARVL